MNNNNATKSKNKTNPRTKIRNYEEKNFRLNLLLMFAAPLHLSERYSAASSIINLSGKKQKQSVSQVVYKSMTHSVI